MRKAHYLILARELRQRIAQYSPADHIGTGEHVQDEITRRFLASQEAASLARYLANHLSVDKTAFLNACGLRP